MKFAAFVPLRSSLRVLGLAGAELTEVLGCLGGEVGKKFHLDPTKWLSYQR